MAFDLLVLDAELAEDRDQCTMWMYEALAESSPEP